jgi:lysozyme
VKTSKQGRDLLTAREIIVSQGIPLKAYRDSKGFWTIGVGHLLSTDKGADFSNLVWTKAQAEQAFEADLAIYEKAVSDCVKVPLQAHQNDALVSFSHNLGRYALAYGNNGGPSSILRALNAGDYMGAGLAFNNWMADPEVRTRRAAEREQFLGRKFVDKVKPEEV